VVRNPDDWTWGDVVRGLDARNINIYCERGPEKKGFRVKIFAAAN
jgi:hypothetical protein